MNRHKVQRLVRRFDSECYAHRDDVGTAVDVIHKI